MSIVNMTLCPPAENRHLSCYAHRTAWVQMRQKHRVNHVSIPSSFRLTPNAVTTLVLPPSIPFQTYTHNARQGIQLLCPRPPTQYTPHSRTPPTHPPIPDPSRQKIKKKKKKKKPKASDILIIQQTQIGPPARPRDPRIPRNRQPGAPPGAISSPPPPPPTTPHTNPTTLASARVQNFSAPSSSHHGGRRTRPSGERASSLASTNGGRGASRSTPKETMLSA